MKTVALLFLFTLSLTHCGKEPEPTPAPQGSESLEQFESDLGLAWESSETVNAAEKGRLDALEKKIEGLRGGIQACKADLVRANPELAQQIPKSLEERLAKIRSVLGFFKTNAAKLSAGCQAILGKIQAFREKFPVKVTVTPR